LRLSWCTYTVLVLLNKKKKKKRHKQQHPTRFKRQTTMAITLKSAARAAFQFFAYIMYYNICLFIRKEKKINVPPILGCVSCFYRRPHAASTTSTAPPPLQVKLHNQSTCTLCLMAAIEWKMSVAISIVACPDTDAVRVSTMAQYDSGTSCNSVLFLSMNSYI
jgi:hypothetical protein